MKVVIIEDESLAAEKLERYLTKYDAAIQVLAQLPSIADSVEWLKVHQAEVDIIFMDVQLTDGLSFEIFSAVKIEKPVIFTTAHDEYAIDAFKVNSIDYILKPITFSDLSQALKKMKALEQQFSKAGVLEAAVHQVATKRSKERFLVRLGHHIHSVKTNEVALFYAEGRTVFLITQTGKKYIIDYKLEELTSLLDMGQFFRANRSFIVNINAIKDVLVYSNSRLKISPVVSIDKEMIVSRERVGQFKEWFAGDV